MSTVSIILPTYNRAKFLPEAFAAIQAQKWTDWELIVIDDGSTDNTRELIPELTCGWQQPVHYIYQENQGAYGARNTGLDHATGKYIAFYDSDDLWLPHHLQDCTEALNAHEDVDWVYGACRMVNLATDEEISPTTFLVDGRSRPFRLLQSRPAGKLRIIDDPKAACCQVLHGLYCGLQNSLIRSRLFENYRFDTPLRNEAEDQVIVIRSLVKGFRYAYLDNVHVEYRVHADNSSAAGGATAKKLRVLGAVAQGFEKLLAIPDMPTDVKQALRQRLGREYFWHLGYSLLWQNGERAEAMEMFRRGIRAWPWDWRCWKTLVVKRAQLILGTAA
jgi:glycosyltransferase involved in cell wall biosynthesis